MVSIMNFILNKKLNIWLSVVLFFGLFTFYIYIIITNYSNLFNACREGDVVITEYYLNRGYSPNYKNIVGQSLFYIAAINQHVDICKLLVKHNVMIELSDINTKNYYYQFETPAKDLYKITTSIKDIDFYNRIEYKEAKTDEEYKIINFSKNPITIFPILDLLKKGVSVNITDDNGKTPLYYLIKNRNKFYTYQNCRIFIEYGANPYEQYDEDRTIYDILKKDFEGFTTILDLIHENGLYIRGEKIEFTEKDKFYKLDVQISH